MIINSAGWDWAGPAGIQAWAVLGLFQGNDRRSIAKP